MKHSVHKLLRLSWKIVMAGLVLPFSALTKAGVTLDGSLGPTGPIPLVDQEFKIPDTVGQTVGTNLFHSFGLFNINTGQSATFTGPSFIENVLGRVTGGSPSFIDGLLRTRFENGSPNLFLLNPAGVLFGPNARLDVQGSFHVSTADYLKLGDGGRFEATNPENSVLTIAPPEAFGFLGENPARIAVKGSLLRVPPGETLSVVGGGIQITDGTLYAPGGRIDMVSVASPGEVLPNAPDLGVASFERLGRIEVSHASSERPTVDPSLPQVPGNEIGNVDASGKDGGRIFIRGGELVADNGWIWSDTRGNEKGQGIDIGVTGQVTMRNGARVTADNFGSGSGGDVTVKAGSLEIRKGAFIRASTSGSGDGGQVFVQADRVFLSGDGADEVTGITSHAEEGSSEDANAGGLTLRAGSLEVRGGAAVSASTFGRGHGGQVLVEADRVFLSGDGATLFTGIASQANEGSGNAGDLTVRAGSLEVRGGAAISTSTFGRGEGGQLLVEADRVFLSGDGDTHFTGIASLAGRDSSGNAGNVTINATDITLQDGGRISAEGMGAGQAGQILIKALDNLRLVNGSQISVATTEADAGDISLEVGNLLHLSNDSSITTSVAGGTGKGGNITLNSVFVVLDEGSRIIANALEGQAGNIFIRIRGGGALFQSPDSLIRASNKFGVEGAVVIDAPDTDIIAGFAGLPANFLDATTFSTPLCAERSGANVSSLVVRKYEVLPDSPYALRVQLPRAIPTLGTAKQSRAPAPTMQKTLSGP